MFNTLKKTFLLLVLIFASHQAFSQKTKVDMTSFKLPFTWELAVKSEGEVKVENLVAHYFKVNVKDQFVAKIEVGLNVTTNSFDGNIKERIEESKNIFTKNVAPGNEISFLNETANSFILCNKEKATNKSTYVFYGFLVTDEGDFDFESPNYPSQTLENCKALSDAFLTIRFANQAAKQGNSDDNKSAPISFKILTNKMTKEVSEGDTLDVMTIQEQELYSKLDNIKTLKKYDVLRVSIFLIVEGNQGKSNEELLFNFTPNLHIEHKLKQDKILEKTDFLVDLIEGVSNSTNYTNTSVYGTSLSKTARPLASKAPVKVVTVVSGYTYSSLNQFEKNEDGTVGTVIGTGPTFYMMKVKTKK